MFYFILIYLRKLKVNNLKNKSINLFVRMSKRAKTLSANSSKKKKLRYYVSFNNEWLKNDLFKNWLRKTDEHNA